MKTTMLLVVLALVYMSGHSSSKTELSFCDVYIQNSTDGICFVKTNGHGKRVKFTAEDGERYLDLIDPYRKHFIMTPDGPKIAE